MAAAIASRALDEVDGNVAAPRKKGSNRLKRKLSSAAEEDGGDGGGAKLSGKGRSIARRLDFGAAKA